MFVTGSQFFVFVACLAFGGACGIVFSLSSLLKRRIKNVFLRIIPDFFAFVITAFLYLLYAVWLRLPNFRLYMVVGVFVGVLLYLKSIHILLAKFAKKVYNILVKLFSRNKTKDERGKN